MDFTQAMAQVQKNKEDQNTSTFGDVVDLAQQGALQTISGVANFVGAEDTARSLDKWANEQYDTLTPEMQEAMAKDIVNDDMSFGEGAKDWRTWLGNASNVLGGMAVTMIPGGAAGKAASLAGSGVKLAQGANVGTNALLNLAAGNGGQGFNVQKDVENLDFNALMKSPKFRQYVVEESDNGVSDEEALNNARERLAGEIGDSIKSDFTLGAVNLIAETVGDQAFGKLLKGSIGKTIKGAIGKGMLTEGGTEAIQGGTEQYRSNVNKNEVMGVEGDNMEGVGANALESGLLGAVVGGGAGAPGGVAGRMRRRGFENKIESVINSDVVGQLRGAGKTDAEIETMLKSKIEDKALSMGFDANESQALAHQAVAAAFGTAPPAAERHATEDQAEAVAQTQQRPEGAERRDQMTQEARQARQQEDNTWSQQNGYPDPRDFGLTQEDAELLIDPPPILTTASGKINPKAPKELKQAYQIAMGRRGAQDYINTVFNNSQPQREAYNQSFQQQQPEPVVSQPDMLEQTQQPQPEAQQPAQAPETSDDHAQLANIIQKGELGFAEQKAEQDDSFKQGLLQAFEYSPSAVLQIAELRRNGKMNEEQAISALQRVINSVELNVPDQLQPTEQETQLRNQQAQQLNAQQQMENRGQREGGFQPNVEETPEFQRNQARLLQGMQERAQTKGAAGGPQFNGERDVSPLATGIEDQYQSDAPQVEFDRWSDVQPEDVNRDERFTQQANEYDLNPEPEQQERYREAFTVAQEPATASQPEQRQPKRNKRQEKKAAKQEAEAAKQLQERIDQEQQTQRESEAPVYQTPGLSQRTEIARQFGKAQAEQAVKKRQKVNRKRVTKEKDRDDTQTRKENSQKLFTAVEKQVDMSRFDSFEQALFSLPESERKQIIDSVLGEDADVLKSLDVYRLNDWTKEASQKSAMPYQKVLRRGRELIANKPKNSSKTDWTKRVNKVMDDNRNDIKAANEALDHIIKRAYEAPELKKLNNQGKVIDDLKASLAPEKTKPKTLKPKKLGDDVPGVTLQGTVNDRRVYPNDENGEPFGTYFKVVKDTDNKQFVIYDITGDVRNRIGYGRGFPLATAVDETNSKISDYADIVRKAQSRISDNDKSNQTAERKTFNKRWDELGTKERRDLVESAMPDSSPKLKTALSRSTGESLELVEYNKLEAKMAKADNEAAKSLTDDELNKVKQEIAEAKQAYDAADNQLGWDRATARLKRLYKLQDGNGTADDLKWIRAEIEAGERGVTTPEKAQDVNQPIAKERFAKAKTGKSDNPRYQAWLDTLDQDELDAISSNADYMSFITQRKGEFFKSKNMSERDLTPDLQVEFDKFIRDYADNNLSDRVQAERANTGDSLDADNLNDDELRQLDRELPKNSLDRSKALMSKGYTAIEASRVKRRITDLKGTTPTQPERDGGAARNFEAAQAKARGVNPNSLKSKKPALKTVPAATGRKIKGKLSKIATAEKKVDAADENFTKVKALNSTERSGADMSNPKVKAAQQRVMTAEKASKDAYDELGEVWKGFKAADGTKEQWDKFVEDQQGHLETNSWDDLQMDFGEEEPAKRSYESLREQLDGAKTPKDFDDLYDAYNAALKADEITEDQYAKLDNGRLLRMRQAGLSGLQSNRYNFGVARKYLIDNVGTPNGVDDVRYIASMDAVRDELKKRGVSNKVIDDIYTNLDNRHVSSRQRALKMIADIVDEKPTPPDGGGSKPKAKNPPAEATSTTKAKKGRTRPSGARNYLKAISSFTDGEYSQAEAIELIDQFIEDKPELEAEFNGYRKNDIGTLFARLGQYIDTTLRKDALVRRAVDNIGSQFSAIKSTSGMFVVNSPEKIRAELAAMSESDYNELAAKRVQKRKEQEAEAERKKKALDNPQTLDDYQAYARANGGTIDAFDNDQLAEFDRLYTENQVERREAQEARELERKAEVKAVETDGSIELSKIDVLNEAKGEQRYGAAFSEVDSDTFNNMRAKAKQLGGWYARAYKPKNLPARFDFKTESARDDFLSVMGGMNVDQSKRVQEKAQEKTQTKQEKQVEGLRQKAAGLQAKADESNNADRLTNTARRASFAASAAAKADRQEAQANILNKIADGVASGKFKLLGNLTDISQLEELTNIMNRVKWDMPEDMREKYAYRDQSGNWHLKPETKFNDVARFVKFPAPQSTPQSLEYIANEIENLDGFKMTAKSIRSNIKGMGENDRVNLNGARWEKVVDKLRKLARAKNLNIYRAEHINELFKSQDRLTRMGITGDITLRHALREYEQANAGKMTTRKEKTRLQKLTDKIQDIVRGNRNAFNDFFPTPEEEAKQVVDLAEIESGMRVLEPSAGMGHIADQIAAFNGVDLDVGELAHTLSEMLEEKGHNVVAGDFLEYHAGEIYDRIVMNPPFSNDADIHHINHALSMLKDGGRLVAITSSMAGDRGNTTNKNFRQYLDEVGAEEIPLEAGTFNKSLNPTNVATKIIVIDKPANVDYDDIRFSKTSEVEAKPARGMRTELVADAAQNWINDYDGLKGVNVTVVPTMEDLYDLVETEDNAQLKGAWLSGDNRVVLVAENLTNAADVRKTLRHELIAHNGLYGNLSNEQQDKLTKQVNSLRSSKALKQIFADVDKAYKTAPENVKAEEVIARIAENEQSAIQRFADRVMTWVMGALRRSGIINQETVSLAEIRTMLNNVDKNLRKPNGKTTLSNVVRFSKIVSDMDEDTASQGDPTLSVADALAADNERFYQQMLGKVKNGFTSKLFDSMKNGGWSLLNLRQVAEVGRRRVGQEVGNILDSYVKNKDLFTTRKSELIEKVHKQAEALNKFRRDEPEQAEKTFSLLHDATLADVDPSQEYVDQTPEKKELLKTLQRLYQEYGGSQNKRGQEVSDEMKAIKKDIKNEPQLRIKHAALREQFLNLSPEGQKTFNDVRDHYISQREEMDKALENRIAELAMAGSMKAGENTYHRYMMEKARLGFYVPLSRFGTYWLDVMDTNGERRFQMYETESEMKADAKKLESAGYKFQNDREADLGTGQIRMGAKLNESRGLSGASASFVSDVVKSISGAQTNDKVKAQLTDEIYQMYLQTMPDRSIRRAFIHRKGVAGYTEDAARVLADQGVKQANQQAKLETEKQFSDLIDHLKTATGKSNNVSAGRLYNEMLQRHDWMLNPQRAAWAQKLTGFGFFWQIGISPASAMLNLGQNWQVALPIIGAKYGFKGTAAEMSKLSAQWAKTFAAKKKGAGLRGEIDTTNGILGDVLNEEERAALRHAIKIGAIDVTQMADLTGMAEQDSKNYTGKMAKVSQFIGAPFHWAEVMNREVAFLTAYRMAKAGGSSKQESLEYATKATWDSHFDYSSRNRARFMQGDVAAVALQFRQYSQNMTYYLFRNFFDAIKGADAETKRQARRQLAGTFGVTFAIGGLNALPIATLAAIANVAYALAGDDDEPWDAETEFKGALADAFGEDIGKHIYYGTMPSVSSRINIDLLRMWVQESDTQDATSWLENMSQQAMGASFGTAMSFARGANYFSEGQYLRAAEASTPKWIKDVLRTARYASEGGTVTNRNGEVMIGDVDPLEYAGQLLGFTPSRLVMTYDRNSALKGYEKKATRRRTSLLNAYWLATRTNDKEGQRSVLSKIQAYNKSEWGRARPITAKVIRQSVKGHRKMMEKSVGGAHYNGKYLKLLQEQQYW
ncbi:PLxRFG domain-containing protein [Vibrio harveyi]|uniref:PLxRFG domain-containing protein n=1 Tax=Vibrio harveyi TaxID=669 RepID=UPI003BB5C615